MNRLPMLLPSSMLTSQLLGTAASVVDRTAHSRIAEYVLGDPGQPARMSTLVIAISDDSGSVTRAGGTDPLSNRYTEMRLAFSVVARRGSHRELGAILHFDTPCSRDVRPTPITRWSIWRLRRGLRVPWDHAGTSQLLPSLRRAVVVAHAYPRHAATLVVLSDFLLLDPDFGQVSAELAAFPGDVHAVILGSRLPEGVLDPRVTVTHVGQGDPPGAVARALFASLITHRPRSRVAT